MSRIRKDRTTRIEVAVLVAAMLYPTLHALVYFVLFKQSAGVVRQQAYLLGKLVQLAIPVAWLLAVRPARPSWKPPGRTDVAHALLLSIVVGATLLSVYHGWFKANGYHAPVSRVLDSRMSSFGVDRFSEFLVNRSFHTVLHSLLEEFYWRWFVFGRLRRLSSVRNAVVISSLAFTGHHVIILSSYIGPSSVLTWLCLAGVAAAGAAWACIYHRTGSLFIPWMTHLAANATLAWIGLDMVGDFAGPM